MYSISILNNSSLGISDQYTSQEEQIAESFVLALLTEQGSIFEDPTLGTPFITYISTGIANNTERIRSVFDTSTPAAKTQANSITNNRLFTIDTIQFVSAVINEPEYKITLSFILTFTSKEVISITVDIPTTT